jgi:protein-disulfide isomerase
MVLSMRVKSWFALAAFVIGLAGYAPVQAQEAWFPLKADDGSVVVNQRMPIELTLEVDRLKGVLWMGAAEPDVTIVEFMDYNCPFCRSAASDLEALVREVPGLQIKFVQNAIISPQSEEAAKVVLASFRTGGGKLAMQLHQRLFGKRGVNDGSTARRLAADLGLDPTRLEQAGASSEISDALVDHMKLAAAMGLATTPSFLIKGVSISGYPGPKAMRKVVESVLACDAVIC